MTTRNKNIHLQNAKVSNPDDLENPNAESAQSPEASEKPEIAGFGRPSCSQLDGGYFIKHQTHLNTWKEIFSAIWRKLTKQQYQILPTNSSLRRIPRKVKKQLLAQADKDLRKAVYGVFRNPQDEEQEKHSLQES